MSREQRFNEIYDATRRKCYAVLLSGCGDPEDAADLFQETYLEVVRVLRKYGEDYIENPEAFVLDLAQKKLWAHYRKKRKPEIVAFPDDEASPEFPDEVAVSPEEAAHRAVLVGEIRKELSRKAPAVRKIFYMYYSMDMKLSEIAGALGLSQSDVKNKLYRTLGELRKIYTEEGSASNE